MNGPMTPPEPLPFEELYDEHTLHRLGFEVVPVVAPVSPADASDLGSGLELEYEFDAIEMSDDDVPPSRSRVGRPISGLMLAAAMSGLGEVLEPEKQRPAMVEFDPGHDHFSDRPVQFVFVPGNPKASRIILRPWLRAS